MIVFSTFDDEEKVEVIVRNAIDQKFAACANVLPLRSIYPWKGKIEDVNELLVIFKTTSSKEPDLINFLEQYHPYDTPEIISIKPNSINSKYLDWLNQTLL